VITLLLKTVEQQARAICGMIKKVADSTNMDWWQQ